MRQFVVAVTLMLPLLAVSHSALGGPAPQRHLTLAADTHVLRIATDMPQPLHWLRTQSIVRSARQSADGTISIFLRDGVTEAILPRVRPSRPVSGAHPLGTPLRHTRASLRAETDSVHAPALVMAPFAWQFSAFATNDQVAGLLNEAGFQVTELKNADVTVAAMKTMAQYPVVYISGHALLDPDGTNRVIVATGEKYVQGDSRYANDISNGNMILGSVDGDPTRTVYYIIAPGFISQYVGQFAPHSLVVMLGCQTLLGTSMVNALRSHGLDAFIGWNGYVVPSDQERAGETVMAYLTVKQLTVQAAVAAAVGPFDDGPGTSTSSGAITQLIWTGDGALTLNSADYTPPATATTVTTPSPTIAPTARPTTPPATASPTATLSPTSTPPTPTATTQPRTPNWRKLTAAPAPKRIAAGKTTVIKVRVTTPGFLIEGDLVTLDGRSVGAGVRNKYTNHSGIAKFHEHPRQRGTIVGWVNRPQLKPKKFVIRVR